MIITANFKNKTAENDCTSENSFDTDRHYLWNKFRNPPFPPDSGLDNEAVKTGIMSLSEKLKNLPHPVIKARAFEYAALNMQIEVSPHDWFVTFGCWDRWDRPLDHLISIWNHEVNQNHLRNYLLTEQYNTSGAAQMHKDFDHSVPDWDTLFSLGFPGILDRARQYRKKRERSGKMTPEADAYFESIEITYNAILKMIIRFRDCALNYGAENSRMAACASCLDSLTQGPPQNTYEVLQFVYLYFMFSEYMDRLQVRSLGNLDVTVYPFFKRDQEQGRYTETEIREFFSYFMMQWASIDNPWGHPFYFGGTRKNGDSGINELSHLILDEFDKLSICSPKLQLKIAPNTPKTFLNKALDMIRRGNSSIVFICEPSIIRTMLGYGVSEEEARTCCISGCYEPVPRARGNTTLSGIINMLKPIELVLYNGVDPHTGNDFNCRTGDLNTFSTFDIFYKAYLTHLENTIESIIICANEFEKYLSTVNPATVYSATTENSLKTAKDAFQDGSVYNISSILTTGFASAVDSLAAIKEFVFDKQEITLEKLKEILHSDWNGYERLRLKTMNTRNKYGNGIETVDSLAQSLSQFLGNTINLRPNGRNGFYISSMHAPPRTFITFGEKTGATPDGRKEGEELSKNMSPVMGMDRIGVTALIESVTRIDSINHPGDFPLDVMLHPSAVQGEEGLSAMRTILEVYMKQHGMAIQFNVFDADMLIDAQNHPERYQNLQIRVCGWNSRFVELSKAEQDTFIKRARNIKQ